MHVLLNEQTKEGMNERTIDRKYADIVWHKHIYENVRTNERTIELNETSDPPFRSVIHTLMNDDIYMNKKVEYSSKRWI